MVTYYDLLFLTCCYIYLDNSFKFFYICTNHFSCNILEVIEFASNWLLHLIIVATVRRNFVQFSQSPKFQETNYPKSVSKSWKNTIEINRFVVISRPVICKYLSSFVKCLLPEFVQNKSQIRIFQNAFWKLDNTKAFFIRSVIQLIRDDSRLNDTPI